MIRSFSGSIHRRFLMLVILASAMILWYATYSTRHGGRLYGSTAGRLPSKITAEISQTKMQKMDPYVKRLLKLVKDVVSSLWWHLFTAIDLEHVVQTTNFIENITEDTLFIYKAFVDLRWPQETLIRVLLFSRCREIAVTLHYESTCISAKSVPVELYCPWRWAPRCKWFSFMLIFNMRDTNFSTTTKRILLRENGREAVVPLHSLPQQRQDTLHVCVPPLYWYWNYAALIQFIEIWKEQGATLFYIYYVSVSRQMMDILKNYEKAGVIRLIRWQMMPRSKRIDPNRWTYRFGHTLSFNDCLYRSPAKYVALVDLDEFIIPSNGTLLPFLRKMQKLNDTAGSFVFQHAQVRFNSFNEFRRKERLDFAWLGNAEYHIRRGPSKTVFMPARVQIVTTNKVREFFGLHEPYTIDTDDGLLYHARSNWVFTTRNSSIFHPVDIFQQYIEPLNKRYQELMSQVLWPAHNPIHVFKALSRKIHKCLDDWRLYGCKTPYHLCWEALSDKDDWIFSHLGALCNYILL